MSVVTGKAKGFQGFPRIPSLTTKPSNLFHVTRLAHDSRSVFRFRFRGLAGAVSLVIIPATSRKGEAMTQEETERYETWICEAIDALGYVSRDCVQPLAELLPVCQVEGPRAVATRWRKTGEQLSREEKRAIGMRSNAFMSRRAFASLTDKGRCHPIDAFEQTIGRAIFTEVRWQNLESARRNSFHEVKIEGMFKECAACQRLGGTTATLDAVLVLAPPDCEREACALMFRPYKDFIGEFVREYQAQKERE
jgi:hypothetical protein